MFHLSVCAIFKNETPYLAEWIEYHNMIGVQHFYLLNNNRDHREALSVLQPYMDRGLVTHIHYPSTEAPQVPGYNEVLKSLGHETKWLAYIDIDEYIYHDHGHLYPLLSDYEQDPRCSALVLHWTCFGSSGHLTKPELHTEAYRFRCPLIDPGHTMVKSIIRPDRTDHMFTPHSAVPKVGFSNMNTYHEAIEMDFNGHIINHKPSHNRARINHYITRSEQEFKEKIARGIACGPSPDWRPLIWDKVHESATVYDDSMLRFVPHIKDRLKGTSPLKNFTDIQGWFNYEAVYDYMVNQAHDGARFVEVGTWLGKSAAYMANVVKQSQKDITFYAVDNFVGSLNKNDSDYLNNMKSTIDQHSGTVAGVFAKNMIECNLREYVIQVVADSTKASKMFEDDSLDFVFLDAAHEYVPVKQDIAVWWPKIKPGGILAGHDYDYIFPGVVKAVNEFFDKNDYDARFIQPNVWAQEKKCQNKKKY
jgi:predicted O-methyltransferase YrrM